MFVSESDPTLREWIVDDMSSSPSQVGIGAVEHYLRWFGEQSEQAFNEIQVPIRAINSDMNPTNREAAVRHGVEIILMSGVGHFVMMEDPERFNSLLVEAVADFSG
jgi:pimeloyl-ACP methyl ester carboxylesterase